MIRGKSWDGTQSWQVDLELEAEAVELTRFGVMKHLGVPEHGSCR